ncbi:DciA family protein [Neisseria chenwenguii]|uniref:Uncharacterized protein n=1 Tax=Neisseria chenwenguii TaxID=1853278 RepID=A0A220RZL3_9NEIS|nr:DciA family protein [Neisseria chenwenguii]ASK26415.1 hypothetical protein BG910_00445 [Neisseria chenwenguii]ROV55838.1 DUF721 domain-containing protein [Neisseria chenwenguii]
MNLKQLGRRDNALDALLQQSRQWQILDRQVKQILPANLRPHFQTACVENGRLVLLAANGMAASRLKMILPSLLPQLRELRSDIEAVNVKLQPKTPVAEKANTLKLSETALENLEDASLKLQGRHPKLAQALENLVKKYSR